LRLPASSFIFRFSLLIHFTLSLLKRVRVFSHANSLCLHIESQNAKRFHLTIRGSYVHICSSCDSHGFEHYTSGISFANSCERVSRSVVSPLSPLELAAFLVCPLVQASIADERRLTSTPVFRRPDRDVSEVLVGQRRTSRYS
jgi:hypothetical protein